MNYGESSDTWTVGQTWDANSTPSSRLWDDSDSQLAVTVLDERDGAAVLAVHVGSSSRAFLPTVQGQD